MLKTILLLALLSGGGLAAFGADTFTLQIAPPVAGQGQLIKSASFVFRSQGCADLASFQVTAKAEGLVGGERKTIALETSAAPAPGVFAVFRKWPKDGVWIVSLSATCGAAKTAGALVAIAENRGPDRKNSKFLAHAPTEADIVAALKK